MKKITLSSAALLLMLSVATTIHAQTDALYASNTLHPKNNSNDYNNGSSNERAVNNFKKEFSTAENASWTTMPDGFMTKFNQNSIKYRVGYNQKGNWQNTVRIYGVENLPASVKKTIDKVYDGYTIILVEEITTREGTVYIVHIENKEWIRQVKVDSIEAVDLEEFEIKKVPSSS
jgi:hypothetical protein